MKSILSRIDPEYIPWQFTLFRLTFGVYLFWYFLLLVPNAAEIFSGGGTPAAPHLNLADPFAQLHLFPLWDSPHLTAIWAIVCLVLAFLFTIGWYREWAALLLWVGWAGLFTSNHLAANIATPYVGILLLLTALVPSGEPLRLGRRMQSNQHWGMPLLIPLTAWILMAAGYTISGVEKLQNPSWINGTMLTDFLQSPLAHPGIYRDLLLQLPPSLLAGATWLFLSIETFFVPLSLFRKGRLIAWSFLLLFHLCTLPLLIMPLYNLSLGMIMLHFFTFDARWLPARQRSPRPIVLYDEECGLCSRAVRFIAEQDRHDVLGLASLQGATGIALMRRCQIDPKQRNTLILVEGSRALQYSAAVLKIGNHLGGIWRLPYPLRWLIPRPARDAIYRYIARNRYRWFGHSSTCPPPSPQLQAKLTQYDHSTRDAARRDSIDRDLDCP